MIEQFKCQYCDKIYSTNLALLGHYGRKHNSEYDQFKQPKRSKQFEEIK